MSVQYREAHGTGWHGGNTAEREAIVWTESREFLSDLHVKRRQAASEAGSSEDDHVVGPLSGRLRRRSCRRRSNRARSMTGSWEGRWLGDGLWQGDQDEGQDDQIREEHDAKVNERHLHVPGTASSPRENMTALDLFGDVDVLL